MVGDDNTVAPYIKSDLSVSRALDALDEERPSTGDTLPLLDEPLDFLPGVGLSMPNARVDPLARVLLEVFGVFLHEHRVRSSGLVTDLEKREAFRLGDIMRYGY